MRTEFSMDSVHEKHMVAARDRKHIGFTVLIVFKENAWEIVTYLKAFNYVCVEEKGVRLL